MSSWGSFRFFGAARGDRERVDGMLHQLAERLVDQAVARDGGLAGKARRDDRQPPMGVAAFAVAGVAAMLLALGAQLQRHRLERLQPCADRFGDAHGLSSMYFARKADCTMTNSSMSRMPPNSLNDAHTFSEKL